VSDSEVLKHVKSNQDLKKKLVLNGTMEVTTKDKSEYLKSFYIAQGAVKPSSTDDQVEFIPRLLRMSGFLPAQIPITFGMLLSAPTVKNTVFFQILN